MRSSFEVCQVDLSSLEIAAGEKYLQEENLFVLRRGESIIKSEC